MKILKTVFIALLLNGCASVEEISLHQKTVFDKDMIKYVIARSDDSKFWINDLVYEDDFAMSEEDISSRMSDPAILIGNLIANRLKKYSSDSEVIYVPNARPQGPMSVGSRVDNFKGNDFLVDIKSGSWFFNHEFFSWYPIYTMQFHLVDINKKALLSSGVCMYDGSKTENIFTKEDFDENASRVLKLSKNKAVEYCTNYIFNLLSI